MNTNGCRIKKEKAYLLMFAHVLILDVSHDQVLLDCPKVMVCIFGAILHTN